MYYNIFLRFIKICCIMQYFHKNMTQTFLTHIKNAVVSENKTYLTK